ncbi:MAG: hypothetical protein U0694_27770 [Anaerolineae bacterium]
MLNKHAQVCDHHTRITPRQPADASVPRKPSATASGIAEIDLTQDKPTGTR